MLKMKNYFIFLLLFLFLFIYVGVLTNIEMKERYEDVKYTCNFESPKIHVEESKKLYSKGSIKGNITNDTKEHLRDKFLQFDFYNEYGSYLGTESQEIKIFNVDEKVKFDINYNYKNVKKIEVSFVDKITKPE